MLAGREGFGEAGRGGLNRCARFYSRSKKAAPEPASFWQPNCSSRTGVFAKGINL